MKIPLHIEVDDVEDNLCAQSCPFKDDTYCNLFREFMYDPSVDIGGPDKSERLTDCLLGFPNEN